MGTTAAALLPTHDVSRTPRESVVRLRIGAAYWSVHEEWRDDVLGPGAPDWFALEDDPRATFVKAGHRRKTWSVRLERGRPAQPRVIFAKVFELGGAWFERFGRLIGGNPAEREWRITRNAERRGVRVAPGVACGVRRGHQPRAVFLSEGLDGAVSLSHAWTTVAPGTGDVATQVGQSRRKRAKAVLERVARLFADAHGRGYVHPDCHPDNVLVRPLACGGIEARFVDVQGARLRSRPVSLRRAARSLAELDQAGRRWASRSERLRFVRAYFDERRVEVRSDAASGQLRSFLSAIAAAASAHASTLVRRRDRRIRRSGKYFSRLALDGGWRATVVLRLERRHVFAESHVPDRDEAQWRAVLASVIRRGEGATQAWDGLRLESRRPAHGLARIHWTLAGSPHRRSFERAHRLRHRDLGAPLVLGLLEHRGRLGFIDRTILIYPASSTDRSSPQKMPRV